MPKFENLPKHVGIIMDGNGRWARQRNFPRVMGHKNAIRAVRETVETCAELRLEVLTLYAFSTENWGRPSTEVDFLMRLFKEYLQKELDAMLRNNIQLRIIGDSEPLPSYIHNPLQTALKKTQHNDGLKLCLAINYGSRYELTKACRAIAEKVAARQFDSKDIQEETVQQHLYTNELPDVDLIIRTSGELRMSNFLLWQGAYAEFYFTDILWPDFNPQELYKALEEYSTRNRRIGRVDV